MSHKANDEYAEGLLETFEEALARGQFPVTNAIFSSAGEILPYERCSVCNGWGGYDIHPEIVGGEIVDGRSIICEKCDGKGFFKKI